MGSVGNILKSCAFAVLGSELIVNRRLAGIRQSEKITILNLHRVAPKDGSGYHPLAPELLDELLGFMKSRFDLITFAELDEPRKKPRAIISFDDGYKDFVNFAAPVLARHKVRVNQNVVPLCIETGLPPLNVLAQDFVGKAPRELTLKLEIPGFPDLSGPNLASRLSKFIKNRPRSEQEALAETLTPQFFAWSEFEPTPMMTRDETRQIAAEHEVGGHSFEHASMEFETDEYLKEDVLRCQKYFQEALDRPMSIYAFPNGACGEEHIEIVAACGVEHVLLVGNDFATARSPYKRFGLDARTLGEAKFRAVGGFRAAHP
jgi:peptidoglycan/xylan/chitin deacetylase (PgdA/CDA1 family)